MEESTFKATYFQAFPQKGKKAVLLNFFGGWMDAWKLLANIFFATAICNLKLFGYVGSTGRAQVKGGAGGWLDGSRSDQWPLSDVIGTWNWHVDLILFNMPSTCI